MSFRIHNNSIQNREQSERMRALNLNIGSGRYRSRFCSALRAPSLFLRRDLIVQPEFRRVPFAAYSRFRDVEHRSNLWDRKPAEEPQLDDPTLLFIERRESVESVIQCNQIHIMLFSEANSFIERELALAAASLIG